MGYQQGLSGLSASSSDLDVIGNNIANANTVGFKSGAAQFADMYANSVATAVGNQVGIGTKLAEVQQQFSQGTITSTNQALDVAINGNGFFQLSNNGSLVYSRNGVFQLDKNGFITNAQGLQLMGYAANSAGIINTAQTVPLSVPTANIAPQATTKIVAGLNLNAQDPLMLGTPTVTPVTSTGTLTTPGATITNTASGTNNDTYTVAFDATTTPPTYKVTDTTLGTTSASTPYTAGTAIQLGNGQTITFNGAPATGDTYKITPTAVAFNQNSSSTYNYSTSTTVYDSLGGSQTVNMYFAKTAAGTWNVYAGTSTGTASLVGHANFNSSGTLLGTTDAAGVATTTPFVFNFSIPTTDGSSTPQNLTLNIGGTTQYGGKDGVNSLQPDGYAAGTLTSFTIGADGTLTGNYSNQQTAALGQIVLANFSNQNGLVNLGNNEFQQTSQSGVAQISAPGATNHGVLQGGAVENSNVDLTSELVNLITAQRNYQANAQTIKTQQTVDQTLINL
ncbi:flagellar hook protein FlgE [Paraburkholderia fungorum]|jgi:flagellar hook protein FlgE|uniref:Flagellar hook protein FlgE n=1 Tax=Paraburkholderia fungorum TaxID=134537 RepID=A0AAJ3XL16_9BURK|nr:flagellar hook protein FlgE [Paraburkholderia fungorum]KFX62198.1 flagellar hook protein FlgE [Burkholderia sp. K24]AJZ60216.1 flagellar hook-basal body family protein [Paraburkholderia fungorum]MBB4515986.1 flagellar hook protein FlgE [Paraburkholderia fungorum]MBB5544007.1 flagellar hook protein FlgE [Paraburkholderia fungorum]MBB6203598.1 flagellar hook protein FlgE [Paraburkholderia fungorum]